MTTVHQINMSLKLQQQQQNLADIANYQRLRVNAEQAVKPLQFTQRLTNHLPQLPAITTEEREDLMFNYITSQTKFLSQQSPEMRERTQKLLRHYIELYVNNPSQYPIDPNHPIHPIIHQAGDQLFKGSPRPKR